MSIFFSRTLQATPDSPGGLMRLVSLTVHTAWAVCTKLLLPLDVFNLQLDSRCCTVCTTVVVSVVALLPPMILVADRKHGTSSMSECVAMVGSMWYLGVVRCGILHQ